MPKVDLIIFDWDDTVAEGATSAYLDCYHQALMGVGINLDPLEERRMITDRLGATHQEIIKELVGTSSEKLAKAVKLYDDRYESAFVRSVEAVAGSRQFLDRLHATGRHRLAIASGINPHTLRYEVMPKFGIDPAWFAKIYTAYDISDPAVFKPHPHSAEVIMSELGIGPDNTIVVGDSKNDVRMARGVKAEPVVVLTGNLSRQKAMDMGVKHIIKDVTRLGPVLEVLEAKQLAN